MLFFRSRTKQEIPMMSHPSLSGSTTLPAVLMIVEDDADIGATLLWAFQSETPYHAVLVTDAVQALEVAQSLTPSLFILDYQLPGMDSVQICPLLIYCGYDSRRDHSVIRSATQTSLRAAR